MQLFLYIDEIAVLAPGPPHFVLKEAPEAVLELVFELESIGAKVSRGGSGVVVGKSVVVVPYEALAAALGTRFKMTLGIAVLRTARNLGVDVQAGGARKGPTRATRLVVAAKRVKTF